MVGGVKGVELACGGSRAVASSKAGDFWWAVATAFGASQSCSTSLHGALAIVDELPVAACQCRARIDGAHECALRSLTDWVEVEVFP